MWFGLMQVVEPIDMLHLIGQDPLNDVQLGATYYIATGDSGQGAASKSNACSMLKHVIILYYIVLGRSA